MNNTLEKTKSNKNNNQYNDKSDSTKENTLNKKNIYRKPHYEINTEKGDYLLKVFIPGVEKNNVDISLDKDVLTITAERNDKIHKNWNLISQEISDSDFQLKLKLNVEINSEKVSANVENGVLDIFLPVAEEVKPRKISINV